MIGATAEMSTAKQSIMARLRAAGKPLAVFEFGLVGPGLSENSIATRLSELQKSGEVDGRYRAGARYKEWSPARGRVNPMTSLCQYCGNYFDDELDPYHRDGCRDANRP